MMMMMDDEEEEDQEWLSAYYSTFHFLQMCKTFQGKADRG